ncbi:hypothetical protein FACS1894130_06520 [Spirochaetia bacterium]|nr:hypothetical protein FACS1894130_06520 [Spirochaetia bacterium]
MDYLRLGVTVKPAAFNVAVLFFLLLLVSCTTTPMPPGNPVTVPLDFAGMVHAGRTETPEEYALLDEMNIAWIANTFYWSSIEPQRDRWNFSRYDSFVDGGKQAEKKILAVLAYDTGWLYSNGKTQKYIAPENIPLFLTFVENTVSRYCGKVDAWEIWNEPNGVFWQGSRKEFFELTKATARKIREVDPDAVILAGAFWRVPESYVRGMFESGAMEQVNAIAFHPYAVNPRGAVKLYDKLVNTLSRYNYTGDIWVTEAGYPTGGWYPNKTTEKNLPAYVVKTLTGLAARGARTVFWYELFDSYNRGQAPRGLDSENFFGLAYPDFSKKKGVAAYALCAETLAGLEYHAELPERVGLPDSLVSFYFRGKDNQNTLVLWNDRNSVLSIQVSFPGTGQLYDVVSGAGTAVSGEAAFKLGAMPRLLIWQNGAVYAPPAISLK